MASPTESGPESGSARPLHVGVLVILPDIQLLDLSPVDLFHMCTKEYLEACTLPKPLTGLGLDVRISYISALPAGSKLSSTGSLTFLSTATLDDAAVQPGQLDVLLIPGPAPDTVPSEAEQQFLRAHAASTAAAWATSARTDILVVCTGIFAAAHAGITAGKTVTAPRGLLPRCRQLFPATTFRDDVRWARDGALWASGGITNGQEMVAAYLRHRWPGPLANVVCALADVGDRPQRYETGMRADTGWFVWQIVRSLWTRRKLR